MSDELARLRQAIWDAYRIMGFDTDGVVTVPARTYPSLDKLIVDAATEFRADYDAALDFDPATWVASPIPPISRRSYRLVPIEDQPQP